MKAFLILTLLVCTHATLAQSEGTGRFRGHYVGVALPVGNVCTTERLVMSVNVEQDGKIIGQIVNFDGEQKAYVDHFVTPSGSFTFNTGTNMSVLPPPPCFPFCANEPGAGWIMRGVANAKSGTIKGSVDARPKDGCKYTFTLYRRHKNN